MAQVHVRLKEALIYRGTRYDKGMVIQIDEAELKVGDEPSDLARIVRVQRGPAPAAAPRGPVPISNAEYIRQQFAGAALAPPSGGMSEGMLDEEQLARLKQGRSGQYAPPSVESDDPNSL
jgi:hypothetical protein